MDQDLWNELFSGAEDMQVQKWGGDWIVCRVCRGCGALVSMAVEGEDWGNDWDHVVFHAYVAGKGK